MITGIRTRTLAVVFACVGGAMLSAPPAANALQRQREVDGYSLGRVRHSGGGSFAETAPGRWTEFGQDGRPIHEFTEKARDAFSVTMEDTRRGNTFVLDLRRREIRVLALFKSPRVAYTITGAEPRPRGWGSAQPPRPGPAPEPSAGPQSSWDPRTGGDVDVGPIWNQQDAERKCRAKAMEMRVEWSGNWSTRGGTSFCGMSGRRWSGPGAGGQGDSGGRDVLRDIEVGPIWNQRDAEAKCKAEAARVHGEWTGQWRTTVEGRQSVCNIRFR